MPSKFDNNGNPKQRNIAVDTSTQGNNKAQLFAKKGTDQLFFGPESVLTPSKKLIRGDIRKWMRQRHVGRWNELVGHKHNELLPVQPPRKISKEILDLNRKQL